MKDIKRKCNPIVNLSQFTSNKKNIEWNYSLISTIKFVAKFCSKINYIEPKKF